MADTNELHAVKFVKMVMKTPNMTIPERDMIMNGWFEIHETVGRRINRHKIAEEDDELDVDDEGEESR